MYQQDYGISLIPYSPVCYGYEYKHTVRFIPELNGYLTRRYCIGILKLEVNGITGFPWETTENELNETNFL